MLFMFIDLNDLKGIIIDIDSFSPDEDDQWLKIEEGVEVLFFSESSESRLKELVKKNSRFKIFLGTPFGRVLLKREVLITIFDEIDLHSYELALLSANFNNIIRMQELPLALIYMSSDNKIPLDRLGKLPDFYVENVDDINSIIKKEILGYFSEVDSIIYDYGSKLSFKYADVIVTEIDYEGYKCNVVCGGRYFNTRDVRYPYHQLSQRIIRNKNSDTNQDDVFFDIFEDMIKYIDGNIKQVDGITRVPSRPSEEYDRFINIVTKICKKHSKFDNLCGSLRCIKNYNSQKGLTTEERHSNIRGVFTSDKQVINKHIILIDDVFSTGATSLEASKVLYEKGAKRVTILVLAVNQLANNVRWHNYKTLRCRCENDFKIKFNSKYNSAFFGCSGYYKSNCKEVLGYFEGIKQHNIDNEICRTDNTFDLEEWEF